MGAAAEGAANKGAEGEHVVENLEKLDELANLLKQILEINERRGTERNPIITAPSRTSPFDFAPRSFFIRGTGRAIPSGSRLPGKVN